MALHGSRISADLKPFHENLEKRFKEMKAKTAPFKKVSTCFLKTKSFDENYFFYSERRLAVLRCDE